MRDTPEQSETGSDREGGGRLAWLVTRQRKVSRRYSRFVGTMKLALPLLAGGLLLTVVAWSMLIEQRTAMPLSAADVQLGSEDGLAMLQPRYVGTDNNDRPFVVSAERATQDSQDHRLVMLQTPTARLALEDGTDLTVTARRGVYDQGRQTLDLHGPIVMQADNGYRFRAESLRLDLEAGSGVSEAPVMVEGPIGRLTANGLRIADDGRQLYFEGDVRTTINRPQGGRS